MLYVYGVEPPDARTVTVPEAWHRLSVVVTELITSGVAAGHCAFKVFMPARGSARLYITKSNIPGTILVLIVTA